VEKQLQEVTASREESQQLAVKLREEVKQAEEAQSAAISKLKADHEAELKTQQEEINNRHQNSFQQSEWP
jgi:hypothetical protein